MKDIHSALTRVLSIGAAAYAADNAPVAIGAGGITFSGSNKIEFKLTHSDDDSTYSDVTDADMLGGLSVASGGIIKSLVAAHAAAAVYRYGYKGGKRYLKLLADFTGTHGTATPIAASILLGHGDRQPEAAQA